MICKISELRHTKAGGYNRSLADCRSRSCTNAITPYKVESMEGFKFHTYHGDEVNFFEVISNSRAEMDVEIDINMRRLTDRG